MQPINVRFFSLYTKTHITLTSEQSFFPILYAGAAGRIHTPSAIFYLAFPSRFTATYYPLILLSGSVAFPSLFPSSLTLVNNGVQYEDRHKSSLSLSLINLFECSSLCLPTRKRKSFSISPSFPSKECSTFMFLLYINTLAIFYIPFCNMQFCRMLL